MKHFFWPVIFVVAFFVVAGTSLGTIAALSEGSLSNVTAHILVPDTTKSLEETVKKPNVEVSVGDARELIIKNYLSSYGSELLKFSKEIVETADRYGLDYRLLVAIAQQESNLCKKIPFESHNCWGYGIYGDKVTRFDSYPEAFDVVARGIRTNYLDQGLDEAEEIMRKYTPPSVPLGGPWARGVNQFLEDLE